MHPILVRIGPMDLHSFGLMMALAWLAASIYLDAHFRQAGYPREAVSSLILWVLGGSLIGARLLYLAVEYPSWTDDVAGAIFSRSGFVFYGGFFGGVAAGILVLNMWKLPVRAAGDRIAPALAMGLCLGRIGCFLAGDDYGTPSDLPWAVTFTDPESLAPLGVPLHPTQLYLSANALVLFVALDWKLKRRSFDGHILALFLILYSVTRFFWEFFRGDPRGIFGLFSTSQWISLLVFPAGLLLYWMWRR